MFEFQTQLIFPTHAVPAAGPLPRRAERLCLRTNGDCDLAGIHIPPDDPNPEPTLILGFGGNAWNAQDVAEYLHELFPDMDVIVFYYRGYLPSQGTASANALISDAPLIYDLAVGRVKPKRVIGIGFSIGSGVVAELAAQRKLDGLVLVTPFDSLKALAQSMFPWLPIGLFFEHEINAALALERVSAPAAIIAAERDEIVPQERTDALRHHLQNLVFDRTIEGSSHNDIYTRSEFHQSMREALARL